MKNLPILVGLCLCLLSSNFLLSQAPEKFNYQSTIRDAAGELIINSSVTIQMSILAASSTGTVGYIESHALQTNDYGMVSFQVGTGVPVTGTFSNIDWGGQAHYLKTEIDTDGNGFVDLGAAELVSVPYALHANENDPTFSNSPAVNLTTTDLTKLQNLEGLVVVNTNNYNSVSVSNYDMVKVEEVINLSSNYSNLNVPNLNVFGGGFKGVPNSTTVNFGFQAVITNCTFEDINISGGGFVTFVNCQFKGTVSLNNSASKYISCLFLDAIISGNDDFFTGAYISNSTIDRVYSIQNSEINNSTIGENSTSTHNKVVICSGNRISDSEINLRRVFTDNDCDRAFVNTKKDDGVNISGNVFNGYKSSESEIIKMDITGTSSEPITISNNTFDASPTQMITLLGTNTNPPPFIISDNIGRWSNSFISDGLPGTTKMLVTSNLLLNGVTLGITGNSTKIVTGNHTF